MIVESDGNETNRSSRLLMLVGLAAMVIGVLDPLEGSVVIVAGLGVLAVGARLGRSRQRTLIVWALLLVAAGVGVLWGFSAIGGFGGDTGRPLWWAIVILPYPVGFVAGLVGGIKGLRETPRQPRAPSDRASTASS